MCYTLSVSFVNNQIESHKKDVCSQIFSLYCKMTKVIEKTYMQVHKMTFLNVNVQSIEVDVMELLRGFSF